MKKQKYFQQILMKKNRTYETQNFYILLIFLLIAVAFLIAVSICCYPIKYWAKRKYLLPLRNTNDELKEPIYW